MLAAKLLPSAVLLSATLGMFSCSSGGSQARSYRDLNKNGKMDVYEDSSQPVEARVDDLLKQMTLEEKAGLLFINGARVNEDGTIDDKPGKGMFAFAPNALKLVQGQKMNHFNLWAVPSPEMLAKWYNSMQHYLQDSTRLGIPMTVASDPRNHFASNVFAMSAHSFSQWCEPLGLGAIGDSALTRQFADVSRREYVAVGIREALHPQIDLSTEPRWPRISGTFGEDAQLTARMAKAYILGYQGDKLDSSSVACMTKHFPGGGPQKEGLDPHFPFQKGQVYPGNNFKYHLIPFEAAFAAHTAAIMPYYGVPMGQTSENVGFSYNKDIITGLLRNTYRPLESATLAEFWNRYYFYYKELLVDHFFYPTFVRYFRGQRRLRMFFATFAAACVGNLLFHFIRDIHFVGEMGLWRAVVGEQSHAFYTFVLAISVGLSQMRRTPQPAPRGWLRGRLLPCLWVSGFFCLIHIFDAPLDREHSLWQRAEFLFYLLGVTT